MLDSNNFDSTAESRGLTKRVRASLTNNEITEPFASSFTRRDLYELLGRLADHHDKPQLFSPYDHDGNRGGSA